MSDKERLQTVIGATSAASVTLYYAEEAIRRAERAQNSVELARAFNTLSMWARELLDAADAGHRLANQFHPSKGSDGEEAVS
ncbi:hypothetical protein [Propionibacterium australiense]|uniref:Uncharacterized protein n=1 Tax=Propionibacterium australiense TaxID=119981 RepID=A0A8B3FNY4_9ACTN|nr:hypothetical protein [Propionibacterium australiense]RLP12231.1 hypothetical protein D7U36_02945 [Propionibacterium australiense]